MQMNIKNKVDDFLEKNVLVGFDKKGGEVFLNFDHVVKITRFAAIHKDGKNQKVDLRHWNESDDIDCYYYVAEDAFGTTYDLGREE